VSIDAIISQAREVLPEAFTDRPPGRAPRVAAAEVEGARPLEHQLQELEADTEPFEIHVDSDPLVRSVGEAINFGLPPLPYNLEDFSDADHEAASEAEAVHREVGFDALAVYEPFHAVRPAARWGIFYRQDGLRGFALLLMRDAGLGTREARRVAVELLRAHERYHFRFELGALHDELALGKPLYSKYALQVYEKVLFTSQCFEESLANRAVTLVRFGDPHLPHEDIKRFVSEFCTNSPPGYCDFNRDPKEMKESLLGQLKTASASSRVGGSEADWLANWTRYLCPEYIVPGASLPIGRLLKCKLSGRIWIIHQNDPDPWPSRPHAHEYSRREKLSLSTGEIFSIPARTPRGRLRPAELADLRGEIARRRPDLALPQLSV
jgi:hypothetical protein